MARKLFIASTGQNSGKSTTSISLIHLAKKKYDRVGFIKPFGPKRIVHNGLEVDKDAALMAGVFGLEDDIEYMSPVVLGRDTTRQVLDGKLDSQSMMKKIKDAVAELEKRCDFIIIEGSGHSGVGSVMGMSNAAIAKMIDAPVLIISGGGVGNVIDELSLNLALFKSEGVEVKVVMPNKLIPAKREETLKYMGLAFKDSSFVVKGGFNYSPILANPTLARISKILEEPLQGDPTASQRIAHHVQLGAASSQRVIDLLEESALLLVNSTRDELLVTLSTLYHIPEYKEKIAGLVIPGLCDSSCVTKRIIEDSNIPFIRTKSTNAKTFMKISSDVSKIAVEDVEKIELILKMAESEIDFDAIDALL